MPDLPATVPAPLRIYVAGPMSGDTQGDIDRNRDAGRNWFDRLQALGHYPFPPHLISYHHCVPRTDQTPEDVEAEYGKWVRGYDFAWLRLCDAIFLMPNWLESRGACMEKTEAERLGLMVIDGIDKVPRIVPESPKSILQEAQALVFGDRQASYGHPKDDYKQQAYIWTGMLLHKLAPGQRIEPHEAALLMVTLKARRCVFQPKRDSIVDMAGYAEVVARIVGEDE